MSELKSKSIVKVALDFPLIGDHTGMVVRKSASDGKTIVEYYMLGLKVEREDYLALVQSNFPTYNDLHDLLDHIGEGLVRVAAVNGYPIGAKA